MHRLRHVLAVLAALGGILVCAAPASAGHGTEGEDALDLTHLANLPKDGPTNSDLAFWGNQVYAGNYDGFRIIDVADRSQPTELVDYPCIGIQHDVGVWDTGPKFDNRRLLFTSVDASEPNDDCVDPEGVKDPVSPLAGSGEDGFEGLRIFDVTTPSAPTYLKAVFTDCGSHTHTVVPVRQTGGSGDEREFALDPKNPDRVFVYVSSYPLASALDPQRCGVSNADGSLTHNKISIVEVPFADPSKADVLKEVPLHPATLGFPGQESQGCHDIGVFIELGLAAAACQGEGQIWDISDPANPDTQNAQRIINENINYFHSGSFSWDGKYAIFGDEEGGAAITHSCLNPNEDLGAGTGATWFYERKELGSNPAVGEESGSFIQTRGQADEGGTICTAHNYNAIPVDDRSLMVSAYYEAGSSMLDFTKIGNVDEVAYFDAQGVDSSGSETNPDADTWSTYWYNGNLFANDIARGVDIFAPTGEAAAMTASARTLDRFNPQTQECLIRNASDNGRNCTAPKPGEGAATGGGGSGGGSGGPGGGSAPCTNVIGGSKRPDKLKGTKGSDRLSGRRGRDRIKGKGGNDCLRGGGGRDRLRGGGGDDEIRAGRGKDRIKGGRGRDTISVARGARDRVDCGPGKDVAVINARKDKVRRNCETVIERGKRDFATATHLQSH